MTEPGSVSHLRRRDWVVRPVDIVVARRLIEHEHYSHGASNTATYLHGLFPVNSFWEEDVQGVAWWIPPTRSSAEVTYPANWNGVLSLSRLAIRPEVPCNGASFLLGASMRLIDRDRWPCLVTYADLMMGHTGAIYRATNWQYEGLTKPKLAWARNGRLRSIKGGNVTRTHEQMKAIGAEQIGRFSKHKFVHIAEPSHGRRVTEPDD